MDDVGLATNGSDTSVTYGAMKEDDRRVDSLDHFMKSTDEPLPQVAIPGVGMGVALPGPDAGAAPMAAFLSGRQDRSAAFLDGKKAVRVGVHRAGTATAAPAAEGSPLLRSGPVSSALLPKTQGRSIRTDRSLIKTGQRPDKTRKRLGRRRG